MSRTFSIKQFTWGQYLLAILAIVGLFLGASLFTANASSAAEMSTSQAVTATSVVNGDGGSGNVSSTAYCDHGTMANGSQTHAGVVAMNGVPFGTKFKIQSGPMSGQVVTVGDRIGHSSDFDVWFSSCDAAINYGRQSIQVEQLGSGDTTSSTSAAPTNPVEPKKEQQNSTSQNTQSQQSSQTDTSVQQSSGDTYTVQSGDTLSAIAAANGTTYQDLAQKNGIAAPYVIHPGQVLQL